ncbi:MAG TPA: outer membrane lipoprotein-sorting protein [Candidatus Binatia bacterium]|nr:outer membrane lipoprotein-sorting protein [Candidatus Binatia bacterium]
MPLRACLLLAAVALVAPALARGETAREILDRRKALEDGAQHWNDRHERMKLTIVDKRGGERVRELEVYERRFPGDESKSIVFFLAPAEVKGTGFLAFNHKGRPADQWLYLPELQRVRQITARARSESFMGTDFSYHDLDLIQEMPSWTEADARSSLRGEETVDGTPAHVIELRPQREDIGYQRIVLWLGKEDLVPRRLELWEGEGEPKKRVLQSDVRSIGAIPTAHSVKVETPAAGSHTTIEVSDVQFNQGLGDDLFSERFLERGAR